MLTKQAGHKEFIESIGQGKDQYAHIDIFLGRKEDTKGNSTISFIRDLPIHADVS